MKKILIILLSIIAFTSCKEKSPEMRDAEFSECIEEVNYKGHKYLIYRSSAMTNAIGGLVHDPDCPCHSK